MITRRTALMAGAFGLAAPRLASANHEFEPPIDDDGLYTQDWFHFSFLDLAEDHADAAAEGKHLIVLFEQKGCPYCRELHRINFTQEDIRSYMQENFLVVQLNLWGDRKVTDFDGEILSEKNLAQKWYVSFTPTTLIFNSRDLGAEDPRAAEAFRMPGYFKPFHYLSGLEFAAGDTYRDQHFQRFLQERFEHLEAQGVDPDVWGTGTH